MKTTILLGTRRRLIAYQIKGNGKCEVDNISFEGFPVSIAYADDPLNHPASHF